MFHSNETSKCRSHVVSVSARSGWRCTCEATGPGGWSCSERVARKEAGLGLDRGCGKVEAEMEEARGEQELVVLEQPSKSIFTEEGEVSGVQCC